MIKTYDKIRLKTGEIARVVEILSNEARAGYIVDVQDGEDDYKTETIFPADIDSIFVEVEQPFSISA
ncbi:hypothetical protein FACS1894217_12540 [Clostridia bacterium]|nr:hypothetical protein FACS1894217_12540 [Clostridia bacterium]